MDIGEVSKVTNLPPSTLRYYEDKGLIKSVGRVGLRRFFDSHVLNQLSLISLGRKVGFPSMKLQLCLPPMVLKLIERCCRKRLMS